MAGDIEAFLKLAAERRRQAQGGAGPAPQQPPAAQRPAQRPAPEPERRPLTSSLKPSVRDSEIVDAVAADPTPYSQSGSVTQVPRPQKQKGRQKSKSQAPAAQQVVPVLKPSSALLAPGDYTSDPMASKENKRESEMAVASRVIQMFKNPASISSAIILSEILKPLDLDSEY